MKPRNIARLLALVLTLLLLAELSRSSARAQDGDPGEVLPADEGTRKLEAEQKSISTAFTSFVNGITQASPKNDKDVKLIDVAAQYYAYRLTWDDYLNGPKTKNIEKVHEQLHSLLQSIANTKADNKVFADLFVRQLAKRVKEVMEKGRLRSKVNGGIMLQRLGQTGQQVLVADMVEVLEGKKYPDYVKLYAIKGLRELFQRQPDLPAEPAARAALVGKYGKAIDLLIAYIERKPELAKDAAATEKKRVEDVHRFFRREAIRALGQFRLPAVEVDAKAKKIRGPVAYWLLKVAANDGVVPSASLSEQVEAAYGLLLLRADGTPYQADVALYVVGKLISTDLATRFNADVSRAGRVEVRARTRRRDRTVRSKELLPVREEPWSLHSARLEFGLGELELATPGPTKKKVADVMGKARLVLSPMRIPFTPKPKSVEQGDKTQLVNVLEKNKPEKLSAFKGFEGFEVKVTAEE